jgi:PmbA protein
MPASPVQSSPTQSVIAQSAALAQLAAEVAAQLNIHKYDIYGSTVDETSVQVDHGVPKQVKASQRSGVTVRVWNDTGRVGVTSTTDLDPIGLKLALETAAAASQFGAQEYAPDFSPEATAPLGGATAPICPAAPVPDLIERLVAAEATLMAAHPAIKDVPYNGMAQRQVERFYLNSAGANRSESGSYSSIYLYSKTEEAGRKPRSAGAFRVSHDLAQLDIEGCRQEAAQKTISHLNYEKIPTGKYTVVFSPEAFLSLLGAFSNLFNAQNILDNQSLSTPESLGQTIAIPMLSVYDDALHPKNISQTRFDGEGTPTRRIGLIEQGVLTGFLQSAGTAKRMQTQPTGHANMGAKVTVGAHYFDVLPGSQSDPAFDLKTADNVILIDDLQALHAGVKALQGSFSLPFDGWLLKNGQKISVESATVAGDFRQLLREITHIEPVAHTTPGGVCPHIWVADLSITGE